MWDELFDHGLAEGHRRLETYEQAVINSLISMSITCAILAFMWYGMKMLIESIQDSLQQVKWVEDKMDPFRAKYGYGHDWVFVMKVFKEGEPMPEYKMDDPQFPGRKINMTHQRLVEVLTSVGFQTRMFYSIGHDEVFIKVRAPLEVLKRFADQIDYQMMLNPQKLQSRLEVGSYEMVEGEKSYTWLPVKLVDPPDLDEAWEHTEYIYGKYDQAANLQDIYKASDGTIFRNIDRIKLMTIMLETPRNANGCGISLRKMTFGKRSVCLAQFPLHSFQQLTELKRDWLLLLAWPMSQPFDKIRDYFGEKIGLYFLWLGTYTSWLISASVIGTITYLDVTFEASDSHAKLIIVFAIFMAGWSTLFLESWKRKQVVYALRWGTHGFEDIEQERLEFAENTIANGGLNEEIVSPVTGKKILYYPDSKRRRLMAKSQTIIVGLAAFVIAIVVAIIFIKIKMVGIWAEYVTIPGINMNCGSFIASAANAIAILVMGEAFNDLARSMTDAENHRTETNYEDALISKSFFFNFINSYISFFFTAFVSLIIPKIGDQCPEGNCMAALQTALSTIFSSKLLVSNFLEVALPAAKNYKAMKEAEAEAESLVDADGEAVKVEPMTAVEEQYNMQEYDIMYSLFADYLEMVIQFGYATLFSAAFPLAPVLAFVNNYVEIRVDAWKITTICRRPLPKSVEDIGTWGSVMETIATFAVITNCALLCFTANFFLQKTVVEKFATFIVIEHALILLKVYIQVAVEDVPEEVQLQLERTEHYVSRVINNVHDDAFKIAEATGNKEALSALSDQHGADSERKRTQLNMAIMASDAEYSMTANYEAQQQQAAARSKRPDPFTSLMFPEDALPPPPPTPDGGSP